MRRAAVVIINSMLRPQALLQSASRQLQRQHYATSHHLPPTSICSRQFSSSCCSHSGLTRSAAAAAASRERSVRVRVDNTSAAAAAADADAQDVLDALYEDPSAPAAADAGVAPAAARQIPQAASAADDLLEDLYADSPKQLPAAISAAAAAPEDVLGALYDADEAGQPPAAAVGSGVSRPTLAVAAAANPEAPQPPPAAPAAAVVKPPGSPTSCGGAGSNSRAPPTYVGAPEIPEDLNVFNNAVLLVDKPAGWTSFDACNAIKKAMQKLGVKKVRAVCLVGGNGIHCLFVLTS